MKRDDRSQACVFGGLADNYAAARPRYPNRIHEEIWSAVGKPARSDVVLDVAAGTGAATISLVGRGVPVVAIDPSLEMLEHAAREASKFSDWAGAIAARAEALPVRSGAAGLITVAQAFHWLEARAALDAFADGLREGGVLALLWNVPETNPFTTDVWKLVEDVNPGHKRPVTPAMRERPAALVSHPSFRFEKSVEVEWSRDLDLESYVRYAFSWSYVGGALEGEDRDRFEARLREIVERHFGAGPVDDRFIAVAHIARRRS